MVGFVIWIVGLVLTIKAALEIWRIHAPIERRLIAIILIVLTSWIGLLFYYFYGKARMPQWLGTGGECNLNSVWFLFLLNHNKYNFFFLDLQMLLKVVFGCVQGRRRMSRLYTLAHIRELPFLCV